MSFFDDVKALWKKITGDAPVEAPPEAAVTAVDPTLAYLDIQLRLAELHPLTLPLEPSPSLQALIDDIRYPLFNLREPLKQQAEGTICHFPLEILENILRQGLSTRNLLNVAQTCKFLKVFLLQQYPTCSSFSNEINRERFMAPFRLQMEELTRTNYALSTRGTGR